MRVVIVDAGRTTARSLAAQIAQVLPSCDVVVKRTAATAARLLQGAAPDVVFVAPSVGPQAGADVIRDLVAAAPGPTYVGLVDAPDPEASVALVDAGAGLVAARPVDRMAVRVALRQQAGGVPA